MSDQAPAELVSELGDMLYRVQCNYEREGSGPGSRFEGRRLEDVQAQRMIRAIREHDAHAPVIVERGTHLDVTWPSGRGDVFTCTPELVEGWAEQINTLRADNGALEATAERLRGALAEIASQQWCITGVTPSVFAFNSMIKVARKALES